MADETMNEDKDQFPLAELAAVDDSLESPTLGGVALSTAIVQEVKKEVKKYSFFNPRLRQGANELGDVYDTEAVAKARAEWHNHSSPGERPYLAHVLSLCEAWPQLTLLADFMEIGSSPVRWKTLIRDPEAQKERISRTNVTCLDYFASGKVLLTRFVAFGGDKGLKEFLDLKETPTADKRNLRLFVVEDLSRDVIEGLGARYDVEPQFFRQQIFDYTWYNTRDRWVDPPRLWRTGKHQTWFQIRYATARYFRTAQAFKTGFEQSEQFNVLRRPDDDLNTRSNWDQAEAKVGISRTRASYWMKDCPEGPVAIMLVDPVIRAGFPLWYGYGNWENTPSMHEKKPPRPPPRRSPYEDIVYWAQKLDAFGPPHPTSTANAQLQLPLQALLHFVFAEWLTMCEYVKTRIGQIEWEISYPEHFLQREDGINVAFNKLHVWRRLVPLYREMLTETLQGISNFDCITAAAIGSKSPATQSGVGTAVSCPCLTDSVDQGSPIQAMRDDAKRILSYLEDYQQRIDRQTSIATAMMSLHDSRTSIAANYNLSRLTWLATFFIPMSFVTGLFSMNANIDTLNTTFRSYFTIALPLALGALALVFTFTRGWWGKGWKTFKIFMKEIWPFNFFSNVHWALSSTTHF